MLYEVLNTTLTYELSRLFFVIYIIHLFVFTLDCSKGWSIKILCHKWDLKLRSKLLLNTQSIKDRKTNGSPRLFWRTKSLHIFTPYCRFFYWCEVSTIYHLLKQSQSLFLVLSALKVEMPSAGLCLSQWLKLSYKKVYLVMKPIHLWY